MISKGEVLHNPVTGELLRFLETSAETNGEYVLVECVVQPGGFVATAHVHPFQTETFAVVDGIVGFVAGGKEVLAGPGDVVVVEPGTAHRFWNAGDVDAVFRCEVRPALQFERLIETMFALARDGKTNRRGLPSPLRLAVIAKAHFDDVRLPFPPASLQRLGLALGAPVGRLLGYTASYDGAVPSEPALAL